LRTGRKMRGKKSPAMTKPLQVSSCFQDGAEQALWRLSLVLREIAINNERVKEKSDER